MTSLSKTHLLFSLLLLIASSLQQSEEDSADPAIVKCLVCNSMIDEIQLNITKINPSLKANVGGYQLDNEGNMRQKEVPFSHSTLHLSDLMDNICRVMDDYVRARDKETGELLLIRLTVDGVMNSKISEVDLIQDSDLNRSVKYYCEEIVSEYEDLIIDMIQIRLDNLKYKVCTQEAGYCQNGAHDEL